MKVHRVVLFKDLSTSSAVIKNSFVEAIKILSLVYGLRIEYGIVEVPSIEKDMPFLMVDDRYAEIPSRSASSVIGILDKILNIILMVQGVHLHSVDQGLESGLLPA